MQEYASKEAFVAEIKRTADLFIKEFEAITEDQTDLRLEEVDRTPAEMLAYQLGWLNCLRQWEADELAGKPCIMPAPGYKWNQLGNLYQDFYRQYTSYSLNELQQLFQEAVHNQIEWLNGLSDTELFSPAGRKWAASTPSNWPIWKWIHINTVAPFKSFRTKIRKWKKLQATFQKHQM